MSQPRPDRTRSKRAGPAGSLAPLRGQRSRRPALENVTQATSAMRPTFSGPGLKRTGHGAARIRRTWSTTASDDDAENLRQVARAWVRKLSFKPHGT
jgi:hypothetical protein